jgi:peptidoglycan hydrolase-like protein with peptidoglycan-binding domain
MTPRGRIASRHGHMTMPKELKGWGATQMFPPKRWDMGITNKLQSQDRGAIGIVAGITAAVVIMAAGAGGALVLTHGHSGNKQASRHHVGKGTRANETSAPGKNGKDAAPITVASVTPFAGAKGVGFSTPVVVKFSQPLAQGTILPTLAPSIPGSWQKSGPKTLEFKPRGEYVPYQKETVTVPAGTTATDGRSLQHSYTTTFQVKGGSVLRLQQLLAELGYMPVTFVPSGGSAPATGVSTQAARLQQSPPPAPGITGTTVVSAPAARATSDIEPSSVPDVPRQPLAGKFAWRFANIPRSLAALWQPGQSNVITTGAVMTFEAAHGLGTDGQAGPLVWSALLKAAAAHAVYTAPYDYVYVTLTNPEYVTVWRDGVNVFTTLANTGIPQSPTAVGTWPVYVRYRTTTMSGTEPNGQHYSDPGIPWVSYFNGGDALHGFLRAQYGFPQSLGCVEMPYASAHTVWPYTPIGTLVTIE